MSGENNEKRRRTVVKALGSALTLGAGCSTAALAQNERKAGAQELGLVDKIDQARKSGHPEKATSILKKHDIEHFAIHEFAGNLSQNSDGVSTQDYYDNGRSSVYFSAFKRNGGGYRANLDWYLKPDNGNKVDDCYPGDAGVIGWDNSVFSHNPGSLVMWSNSNTNRRTDLCTLENEPVLDNPTNAVGVKFDDMVYYGYHPKPISGGMSINFTKTKQARAVIAGEFSHTWNLLGTATYNLSESLSFSVGSGVASAAISISLPSGADKWQLPHNPANANKI